MGRFNFCKAIEVSRKRVDHLHELLGKVHDLEHQVRREIASSEAFVTNILSLDKKNQGSARKKADGFKPDGFKARRESSRGFATRVQKVEWLRLRLHKRLWRQWPICSEKDLSLDEQWALPNYRKLVDMMKSDGLVSRKTYWKHVPLFEMVCEARGE